MVMEVLSVPDSYLVLTAVAIRLLVLKKDSKDTSYMKKEFSE